MASTEGSRLTIKSVGGSGVAGEASSNWRDVKPPKADASVVTPLRKNEVWLGQEISSGNLAPTKLISTNWR